jgi:hypothetical protein
MTDQEIMTMYKHFGITPSNKAKQYLLISAAKAMINATIDLCAEKVTTTSKFAEPYIDKEELRKLKI